MMPALGVILFLLAVTGIGALADRWLRHGDDRAGRRSASWCGAGRLGTGRRAGSGWAGRFCSARRLVGLGLHLPLAIDGRITHRSFGVVAALGLAAWGWIALMEWRRGGRPRLGGWMIDLPLIGKIMLGVVLVPAVMHSARSGISGYDARTIYGLKARILYDTGTVRSEDFTDNDRINFNPGYPLLLPLLESQLDWAQGGYESAGLKFLFLGFALALVSVYAGEARRFEGAGFAAASALLLLLTPVVICCFEGAGLSGSADLPLAALLFAGVIELSRWLEQPNCRTAIGAGLLLGAAALTKTEGAIWLAAIGAALAATWLFRRRTISLRPTTLLPAIGIVGLALALGHAVHRGMPDSPYYPSYFAAIDWQWLKQLGHRPGIVVSYAAEELFRLHNWNLIWLCVLGSLVWLKRGRLPAGVLFWRFATLVMAAAYLTVLILTPLHLYYQLYTSMTRLMLHFYPLAVLIMSEQIAASGWSRQLTAIFDFDGEPKPFTNSPPAPADQRTLPPARAA